MRAATVVRLGWGTVLLIFPDAVLRHLPGTGPDRAGSAAVRVLGARHVGQGLLSARGVLPPVWAAATDALHAVSMAGLALTSARWRTAALADFVIAVGFVVTDGADSGFLSARTGYSQGHDGQIRHARGSAGRRLPSVGPARLCGPRRR
ncbi:hypothetical protein [Streptomyces longisporus]|uniref:Uncharacterized protein n=1 Tax=Streptomyces longisporus TaxID=1948 RepID=A0ABN3LIU6_STRLO